MNSVKTYGLENVKKKKPTVYSDLDLCPVTLDQGHDTSLGLV
jgi:hypothetical protein